MVGADCNPFECPLLSKWPNSAVKCVLFAAGMLSGCGMDSGVGRDFLYSLLGVEASVKQLLLNGSLLLPIHRRSSLLHILDVSHVTEVGGEGAVAVRVEHVLPGSDDHLVSRREEVL